MAVTKGPSDPARFRWHTSAFERARDGFEQYLKSLLTRIDCVLLPGYVGYSPREGSGVLDPVLRAGMPFDFYRITDDLQVDVQHLSQLLSDGRRAAVLVIHYFGRRAVQLENIHDLARSSEAVLVEDWAHGLFGHASSRPHGDAAIYALHKMYPVPSGGVLLSRTPASEAPSTTTATVATADYDVEAIANRRRRNFTLLNSQIARGAFEATLPITLLWPSLEEVEVPQSLPVTVPPQRKDELYHSLNAAGFGVTSLYHTMVDHLDPGSHSLAHRLSRSILNLPVHQDMSDADCREVGAAFLKALSA